MYNAAKVRNVHERGTGRFEVVLQPLSQKTCILAHLKQQAGSYRREILNPSGTGMCFSTGKVRLRETEAIQ